MVKPRGNIDILPDAALDKILGAVDFSTIFNAFRISSRIQNFWNGLSEKQRTEKLRTAKILEDTELFDNMSPRDKLLVDRLITTALSSSKYLKDKTKPQYNECFSVAVHIVFLSQRFREMDVPERKTKDNLVWKFGYLVNHWNRYSTARLFDILNEIDRFDGVIGKIGHAATCECYVNLDEDFFPDCTFLYEENSWIIQGIVGGLELYLDLIDCTKKHPLSAVDENIDRSLEYIEKRMDLVLGTGYHWPAGFEFVGDAIKNRFLYPYRQDPEVTTFPGGLKTDKPFMKDLKAFIDIYNKFDKSGSGASKFLCGFGRKWCQAPITIPLLEKFSPERISQAQE